MFTLLLSLKLNNEKKNIKLDLKQLFCYNYL